MKTSKIFMQNIRGLLIVFTICSVILMGCQDTEDQSVYAEIDINGEIEPYQAQVFFKTLQGGEVTLDLFEDGSVTYSFLKAADSDENFDMNQVAEKGLNSVYQSLTGEISIPEKVQYFNDIIKDIVQRNQQSINNAETRSSSPSACIVESGQADVLARAGHNYASLQKVSLSRDDFISLYCPASGWDFGFCWTNKTNTGYVDRRAGKMISYAYVYRGTCNHRLVRHRTSGWTTLIDHTVPAGYLSFVGRVAAGLQDRIRIDILNAEGDGWHMAIMGNN